MRDKEVFCVRQFLNRKGHHSNASIYAEITRCCNKDKKGKVHYWHDAELKIADCDRTISLAMDLHNISGARNSLYKLDLLIKCLQDFRVAFAKETELLKKRKK